MSLITFNVLTFSFLLTYCLLNSFCHNLYTPAPISLLSGKTRFGPLRVLAFVFVFRPLTGSPLLCLIPPVRSDLHESLDVEQKLLSSKVSLYHVVGIDDSSDLTGVFFCQISDSDVRINSRFSENLSGCLRDRFHRCMSDRIFSPLYLLAGLLRQFLPCFPRFHLPSPFPGVI